MQERKQRLKAKVAGAALIAMLAGCGQKTPKGQVLAVVNGQEVTAQDVAAEARARKIGGKADQKALLNEVVGRVLLAQDAHNRKLDRYPGYPADISRLQQAFVAEKVLAKDLRAPAPPSDAQVRDFIAAHPFAFANRQKLAVELIRYTPGAAAKTIGDPSSLQAAKAKLTSLNITFDQAKQVLDTAAVPSQLAQHLVATPNGQYVQFLQNGVIVGMVIDAREPIAIPEAQQVAIARQAMGRAAAEQQVRGLVDRLRARAKISYQPGLAPPPPTAASATPAPGAEMPPPAAAAGTPAAPGVS